MGCCIAIALVIGLVRRAWFAIFPGRAPVVVAFAPPARRPAPGEALPASPSPSQVPVPTPAGPAGSPVPLVLGAVGLTTVLYALVIGVLDLAGVFAAHHHHGTVSWVPRNLLLLVLAVALLATAAVTATAGVPAAGNLVLVAGGVTWFVLGVLDMHVFDLFHIGDLAGLVAFHGVGLVAAAVGTTGRAPAPRTSPRTRVRTS